MNVRRTPSGPAAWTGVSGPANSAMRCRQPPQHVVSCSPLAIVSTSTIVCSPAATIAAIAPVSAHVPSGYDTFSTLHPAYTAPEAVRTAAPTGKSEYGACALACTRRAAASRSSGNGGHAGAL